MDIMKTITVQLKERSYQLLIGNDIYKDIKNQLLQAGLKKQLAIITTGPVSVHYLKNLLDLFGDDWKVIYYEVPDGEGSKSIEMSHTLYTWLIENKFERNSTIIALGGGVVGDLAGFIAATYLRGINLVHLPTSLLAMVDSSIGGKVGINHSLGKNLIGAFYQPKFVMIDIAKLITLPEEEFTCGLGEVIKYGLIYDKHLFTKIDDNFDNLNGNNTGLLQDIVYDCAKIKAEIVSKDERESGLRSILNFGHTFGHALEVFYQYSGLKHGQAVLLGMKCANYVANKMNLLSADDEKRINHLIDRIDIRLPGQGKSFDSKVLLSSMYRDKKVEQGSIKCILLEGIGKATSRKVDDEKLLMESFKVLFT
jgi:3-dehydroquinate synthase